MDAIPVTISVTTPLRSACILLAHEYHLDESCPFAIRRALRQMKMGNGMTNFKFAIHFQERELFISRWLTHDE